VLGDLAKKAEEDPTKYAEFWENYGAVIKEGLYEDFEHRDSLFKLLPVEGLAFLAAVIDRSVDHEIRIAYPMICRIDSWAG